MEIVYALIGLAIGVALGAGGLYVYETTQGKNRKRLAEEEAERLVQEAQNQAKQVIVEAKDEAHNTQREAEDNAKKRRAELDRESDRLTKRRDDLDARYERLDLREQNLNKRQSKLDKRQNELTAMYDEQKAELERVAEMTREEARQELLSIVEEETRNDMARRIREIEEETKIEADRRARDIIALAIQRIASEQVNEIAVSVVPLPTDEMKGRIIGRNGRNIRSFEQATGVDVVVDDTPEAVTISSFDPIRREVARRTMEKLVLDGRIHPARIEKLVSDSRKEVERIVREEGERAAYEAGVPGLHSEIIKLLGRLKFRTSYGQNQHAHAIETAHIAGMIAAELGADVSIAKAGGLLHDIGKAVDHEIEGTHAQIGADIAKRFGVGPRIVNAIASHHHEVEQEYVESIIVEAADAISGARPGARRESLDTYIRRVKALEDIAREFEGVDQSFALQAGREVRIMVKPDEIDDLAAMRLARDISRRIEETMQYPGQIKVTIIRETRAVDYAK
ncbi:MAG TPA: ribonuclease Y [Aggregatilinea sp.]|jgi:ribonuclease Y|uniref:ribonuclease Y n=1 Tax=Aggregatilinea sp. TaxID=2806333 RepID=UPI002C764D1E|nr:ribonuclease Y [Aggregatilinea sp.]HML21565.1 ribonuclease Y [Aggregatilinea sp.]